MSKWTSYGKIYRPDVRIRRPNVRAYPHLSRGRIFTVRADGKKYVRADRLRPRGHLKKKILKIKILFLFLVVVAYWKREDFFFGFRFSIPKIPEFHGLRGRSRKNKVFSA
jgi:hypothetical protein